MFLVLVSSQGETRVQCYHRVEKFAVQYGGEDTPWDGRAFAFKGDFLWGGHILTVEWKRTRGPRDTHIGRSQCCDSMSY